MQNEIEQMAKAVCHLDRTCEECMTSFECKAMTYAKRFYEAGYRKSTELAEEIFAEIEENVLGSHYLKSYEWNEEAYAELKKKYESEKDNGKV